METTFKGYARPYGPAGTRNNLIILPTVFCANETALDIAAAVPGARALPHHVGCGQLAPDVELITKTMIGLAANPNVGAALLVGLGCEAVDIDRVEAGLADSGKPVEKLVIQKCGGMEATVEQGRRIAAGLAEGLARQERVDRPLSDIVLAVKCGSSDATSGLASNPAVGRAVDALIDRGATVLFGETTEFIGAEHILAQRAADRKTADRLLEIVDRMEQRIIAQGVDLRGSQPTPGNIAGGLSSIEEKSLGAIAKSGTRPIDGVYEYADPVRGPGLFIMDSPGKEDVFLTGAAAAGANLMIFSTGGGAPQGHPIAPVIKAAGNPDKVCVMRKHVDVDASGLFSGTKDLDQVGADILAAVLAAASGRPTAAEQCAYDRTIGFYTHCPTV